MNIFLESGKSDLLVFPNVELIPPEGNEECTSNLFLFPSTKTFLPAFLISIAAPNPPPPHPIIITSEKLVLFLKMLDGNFEIY